MTQLVLLLLNICFTSALLFGTLIIVQKQIVALKQIDGEHHKIIWFLTIEHFIFSFLFYLLTYVSNADAVLYFEHAKNASAGWFSLFQLGTGFIKFIVYPFAKIGISFFNVFMLFSLIGLKGFFHLYELLVSELASQQKKWKFRYLLFLFLPTFHFYTSGIGKDALVFYFLTMLFLRLKHKITFNKGLVVPIILIFLIRPHVAVFLMMAYFVVLFLGSKIKLQYKFFITILGLGLFITTIPILERKIDVDFSSLTSIEQTLNRIQSYGTRTDMGSSAIDVTNAGIPFKMFAYGYLPLIWKADSAQKYIVSLENIYLLLLLLIYFIKIGKIRFFKNNKLYLSVIFVFSIITWFVSSLTLYNLGLSTRQKYMFVPFLYLIIALTLLPKKTVADET